MKILFIPMLPTMYGRRYQICKHLALHGNEVHMITWTMPYPINLKNTYMSLKLSWRKEEYVDGEIYIHKIRRLPFFFPIINRVWFQYQLNQIINKFRIESVISQSFFNETEPPMKLEVPLYFDFNDNYEAFARIYGSRFYKLSYRLLQVQKTVKNQLIRADAIFAVSDILVERANKYNDNVFKITNGVDELELFGETGKPPSVDKYSLVYVSTFGKWSKIIQVIKVVEALKAKFPSIKLTLIGEGTEFKSAKEYVDSHKLEKYIKLQGHIYNVKRLYKIVKKNHVCLNISDKNEFRDSASPIKVLEYAALGKVIVSTNVNEVVKLHLPNIIIYESENQKEELEAAIIKAFNSPIYYPSVQKKIVDTYGWNNLTGQMLKVMSKVS